MAPGTVAPVGSLTVPVITPDLICPSDTPLRTKLSIKHPTTESVFLILDIFSILQNESYSDEESPLEALLSNCDFPGAGWSDFPGTRWGTGLPEDGIARRRDCLR